MSQLSIFIRLPAFRRAPGREPCKKEDPLQESARQPIASFRIGGTMLLQLPSKRPTTEGPEALQANGPNKEAAVQVVHPPSISSKASVVIKL